MLVDFDIAGAHAGKGRVGTIGYVAPEVAAGEKPTPAADVFGLAATAVTLLNGRPADARRRPTYPGIDPGDQGQLARVLRAALAVDPDQATALGDATRREPARRRGARPPDRRRRAPGDGGGGCAPTLERRPGRDARRDGSAARRPGRRHGTAGRSGRHLDERRRPHDRGVPRALGGRRSPRWTCTIGSSGERASRPGVDVRLSSGDRGRRGGASSTACTRGAVVDHVLRLRRSGRARSDHHLRAHRGAAGRRWSGRT